MLKPSDPQDLDPYDYAGDNPVVHGHPLAGLEPGGVLAATIGERDLTGARDMPSVIDVRLRQRVSPLVPLPFGSWWCRKHGWPLARGAAGQHLAMSAPPGLASGLAGV